MRHTSPDVSHGDPALRRSPWLLPYLMLEGNNDAVATHRQRGPISTLGCACQGHAGHYAAALGSTGRSRAMAGMRAGQRGRKDAAGGAPSSSPSVRSAASQTIVPALAARGVLRSPVRQHTAHISTCKSVGAPPLPAICPRSSGFRSASQLDRTTSAMDQGLRSALCLPAGRPGRRPGW